MPIGSAVRKWVEKHYLAFHVEVNAWKYYEK